MRFSCKNSFKTRSPWSNIPFVNLRSTSWWAVWEDGFALYLSLQTSPFQPRPLWKPHVLSVLFSCRGAGWNSETLGLNKTGNSWKKSPGLFRGVLPVDLFVECEIHPYLPASENFYRFTHQLSNYSDKPRFKWNAWNTSDWEFQNLVGKSFGSVSDEPSVTFSMGSSVLGPAQVVSGLKGKQNQNHQRVWFVLTADSGPLNSCLCFYRRVNEVLQGQEILLGRAQHVQHPFVPWVELNSFLLLLHWM